MPPHTIPQRLDDVHHCIPDTNSPIFQETQSPQISQKPAMIAPDENERDGFRLHALASYEAKLQPLHPTTPQGVRPAVPPPLSGHASAHIAKANDPSPKCRS